MQSTGLDKLFFTKFEFALLESTGFYAEFNKDYEAKLYYGKNRGCDFFYGNGTTP